MICEPQTPPGLPEDFTPDEIPCCYGSAMDGPRGCDCWRPVYDLFQKPRDVESSIVVRSELCHDCAFRAGSPEQQEDPEFVREQGAQPFYCHQGMRRIVAYEHPDGRKLPADPREYAPHIVDGVPLQADGTAAALCAGWAAVTRHGWQADGINESR